MLLMYIAVAATQLLHALIRVNHHEHPMRHFLLSIGLLFLVLDVSGQDKKDLTVSVGGGVLNSPYYANARAQEFYTLGFDYHASARHVLAVNYLAGGHRYFDNVLSNTPASDYLVNPGATNAEATYNTFSILYKYKLINHSKISVAPGVGAGIMTHSRRYPHKQATSLVFHTSSWSDLVFPVTLDISYKAHPHWQLGLIGGFLVHPEYPLLALHAGPKISYVLK